MAIPWLRLLDLALGVTNLAQGTGSRRKAEQLEPAGAESRSPGRLETRLAGVMVAALKEVFERDTRRLEFEREQMEAERRRAERAARLDWMRQAGDREIARLRLVSGVAIASWLGTLFVASRLVSAGIPTRVALGVGWAFLLAAFAVSFAGQARLAEIVSRLTESSSPPSVETGVAGVVAASLIVIGLAAIALGVLVA